MGDATIPAGGAPRLKSFIERVEKLLEERKAIQSDIRDVFSEAKGVGYDVKTMRKLITIRAMDAADRAEQETLLDTYAHALGMETAVREPTEEELTERASRVVAEVDRCMSLSAGGAPPKIADIQSLIGCSTGKAHKLRQLVIERISRSEPGERENENPGPAREMVADDLGDPLLITNPFRARVKVIAQGVRRLVSDNSVVNVTVADDDLAFPAHLDRRRTKEAVT